MFDLPCPKRFLRLSTALLAMVTYRCMLPPVNRRAEKIKHNKTLSGGPCIRFNTVLFFVFVLFYVLCIVQPCPIMFNIHIVLLLVLYVYFCNTYRLAALRKAFYLATFISTY